ncbi:MAG: lipid hydroperoxide peroxidase [Phycisphaerae bacterium]|jgi:thiol peroxidase|nr:lipid hydroperoxide peroxidase [Phycisphaerae bacterium]
MPDRTGVITFKGGPLTLEGDAVNVGDKAPDATLAANDLSEKKLSDYCGKVCIVSVVPSLDTPVCDTQSRKFNGHAGELDNVAVLTISADLPFAQARWCGAADATHVEVLSDYKTGEFGKAWGLRIKELGLLTRAVYVVNGEGTVTYEQIVPEVTEEPDYDAALAAARAAG